LKICPRRREPAAFSLQREENDALVVLALEEKSRALCFHFDFAIVFDKSVTLVSFDFPSLNED